MKNTNKFAKNIFDQSIAINYSTKGSKTILKIVKRAKAIYSVAVVIISIISQNSFQHCNYNYNWINYHQ